MYAWELPFIKRITTIRNNELTYAQKVTIAFGIIVVLWDIIPILITLATFLTYLNTGTDHILTAEKAFVSLTVFSMIRAPLVILPTIITKCVNVSMMYRS